LGVDRPFFDVAAAQQVLVNEALRKIAFEERAQLWRRWGFHRCSGLIGSTFDRSGSPCRGGSYRPHREVFGLLDLARMLLSLADLASNRPGRNFPMISMLSNFRPRTQRHKARYDP
jgi:hypothetical protein